MWAALVSFDNLYRAFRKAARGKRGKPGVAAFEYKLEEHLLALQQELKTSAYHPSGYTSFYIHDPKKRLISAARFRDRVVHHALCNLLEPLYERKFIYDSYANRVGKGTHRALDRCTQYLRRFRYVLPLDVRQFFPSIDHAILLAILAKTIADARVLALCAEVLASGQGVLQDEYDMVYFTGDDLLAAGRPRGLPIGNLTSQFWANVYLNDFDHWVKRELKCRNYLRYVDDMLLFADEKRDLLRMRAAVIERLAALRLTVHVERAQVRPCSEGVPFLGFQVFQDHRRLKRAKAVHARRRIKEKAAQFKAGEICVESLHASVLGWINHARYGDTWGLRRSILREVCIAGPRSGETIADLQ